MLSKVTCFLALIGCSFVYSAEDKQYTPKFSTAGFYQVNTSPTKVFNFNVGWRFFKGKCTNAEKQSFNDQTWSLISAPHSLNLLPLESSGCNNYQGDAWYRKRFSYTPIKDKKAWLHFEGIMGKSTIWINGKKVAQKFGGFLPIHIDATPYLQKGENIIAVWCDNSNDKSFPPGKPQEQLDYSYYGGIYRDVWLLETSNIFITDPNAENVTAGGGIFVWTKSIDLQQKKAVLDVKVHVRNTSSFSQKLKVIVKIPKKNIVKEAILVVKENNAEQAIMTINCDIEEKDLWSPDSPTLHDCQFIVLDNNNQVVDERLLRVGIRTFELKTEGFFLNGKPFNGKLIGANRHQDFAHIGFALPNSLHYRDVLKLREAGVRVIRNAHYPQDPSFMDACDELGVFVIINTPGWQFWNNAPSFVNGVYSDIANMVRRDRNHASTFIWEPILNETAYPADFAQKARDIVRKEYPVPYCYNACDSEAYGSKNYDIMFRHAVNPPSVNDQPVGVVPDTEENFQQFKFDFSKDNRPSFTREFGDNVDNWNAHNSPSRVLKEWGEIPQLIQAKHYSHPDYLYSSITTIYRTPPQHFGGTLWHAFDHGRGYHPDNFFGGIMDATRQPKTSYYAFKAALLDPTTKIPNMSGGYFVHVAHEMTPFSPKDITCFSNCDEVRIKTAGTVYPAKATHPKPGWPSEAVIFENSYNHMNIKSLVRSKRTQDVAIIAEGLVNGKVVATQVVKPSFRRTDLSLIADNMRTPWFADGSDIMVIVAKLTDKDGTVKHLSSEHIVFSVEGDAEIIDDGQINVNPQKTEWGEAVILLRAGLTPGKVTVYAKVNRQGKQISGSAKLELITQTPLSPLIYSEVPQMKVKSPIFSQNTNTSNNISEDIKFLRKQLEDAQKELNDLKLKEVERDQQSFENGKPSK